MWTSLTWTKPLTLKKNDTLIVNNFMRGQILDLIHDLQSRLNFSVTISKRKLGGWGIQKLEQNGTLTIKPGMIKDMWKQKADMIASSVSLIALRLHVLDYSYPIGGNYMPFTFQ